MRTKQFRVVFATLISLGIAMSSGYSQEGKKVITVTGDINVPYDVIDAVAFVKPVTKEVSLLGSDIEKSFNTVLMEAFGDLEKIAPKAGAEAVINVQLQFVVLPGPRGNVNLLLVYGTLVKFKTTK